MNASAKPPALGVFDSGVGGLSVLRELRRTQPRRDVIYVADTLHAPYGERDGAFVQERAQALAAWLIDQGCAQVVVACNTATAWAVDALRARWPERSFVGVEPGVKPAAAATRNGRIAVLATPATLRSARFRRLCAEHAAHLHLTLPDCHGLAAAIERAAPQDAALQARLDRLADEIAASGADTVVLGCTHYPFVLDALRARLPGVGAWIDTAEAIARRVGPTGADGHGELRLYCTGPTDALQRMVRRWLLRPGEAAPAVAHLEV